MSQRPLVLSLLLALSLVPLGAQAPAGKEELKLKLPKPMFIGTPTNIRSPNLEKVTGKSRPPFLDGSDRLHRMSIALEQRLHELSAVDVILHQ